MADGLTGNLAQLALSDILSMLTAGKQTGRLELVEGNARADIYLAAGAICHATAGAHAGEAAMAMVVSWQRGTFRFESHVTPPETTISKPLEQLLTDARRAWAEREAIARAIPAGGSTPRLSAAAPAGPITLQPHEWLVITHINGQRTITDIAASMGRDDFAVGKVIYRLVAAKLVEVHTDAPVIVARPTTSQAFFRALTQATASAVGPLASIIVEDAIEDLGASKDAFPRELVSSLVERVAGEIRETDKRMQFQQTMLATLRQLAA
jgi:hypothetical protein